MVFVEDALDNLLEQLWQSLCRTYDVTEEMPCIQNLFAGVNLSDPARAAEAVLACMLTEIIDNVHRFSPWYRMPARSFGLIRVRDAITCRTTWVLAPDAVQRWQDELDTLAHIIRQNTVLLEATRLVDSLMRQAAVENECLLASCNCIPPHSILINRAVAECGEIICSVCHQPFRLVEPE